MGSFEEAPLFCLAQSSRRARELPLLLRLQEPRQPRRFRPGLQALRQELLGLLTRMVSIIRANGLFGRESIAVAQLPRE